MRFERVFSDMSALNRASGFSIALVRSHPTPPSVHTNPLLLGVVWRVISLPSRLRLFHPCMLIVLCVVVVLYWQHVRGETTATTEGEAVTLPFDTPVDGTYKCSVAWWLLTLLFLILAAAAAGERHRRDGWGGRTPTNRKGWLHSNTLARALES